VHVEGGVCSVGNAGSEGDGIWFERAGEMPKGARRRPASHATDERAPRSTTTEQLVV